MDDRNLREATVLVAPPDNCPHCRAEHIWPYGTGLLLPASQLQGFYRCGDCGYHWNQPWRIQPVTPTSQDHLHD